MLWMITGLPGAGKTQFTLHTLTSNPQLLNREVHYYGIPELQLPWVKLNDPKQWPSVPDGSVIVIDEAQKIFPLRSAGSLVPPHVSEFETHRHKGLDIILVTQDASLVDAHVRKLTERHFVLKRPFGLEYAKVHEFHGIGDINNSASVKQAVVSRFNYRKELYTQYKSATVHLVKKRMPLKALLLPLALAGVVGGGYVVYNRMFSDKSEAVEVAAKDGKTSKEQSARSVVKDERVEAGDRRSLPRDVPSYIDEFTPRHPDMPASAPIYDQLVSAVKDFPRIIGCMKSDNKCWCYSQQGTRLDTRPQICQQFIAQGGFFDPYRERRQPYVGRDLSSPVSAPMAAQATGNL